MGEQSVPSSVAGALNATTPLWTLAIGAAARTERDLSARRLDGLVVGFLGALLILAPWSAGGTGTPGGAVACLAGSLSYGLSHVYMGRYLTGRGLPPLVLSAAQLVAATGWLVLATPVAGRAAVELRGDVVAAVLILGTLGTGAAYVLNYRRRTTPIGF